MTTPTQPTTTASRLADRLGKERAETLREKYADAYGHGEMIAEKELDSHELESLDSIFEEHVRDVAVHTIEENVVWDAISNAIGDSRARELFSLEGGRTMNRVQLTVCLVGVSDTWRDAQEQM